MIAKIKTYIQNILLEWQKVSKPDWEQVRGSTIVVLIASAMLGVFIWLVDGNTASPKWDWPTELFLVLIPIGVFFLGKGLENRRLLATGIALLPLVVVIANNYLLNQDGLKGFGMSFLRNIFLR